MECVMQCAGQSTLQPQTVPAMRTYIVDVQLRRCRSERQRGCGKVPPTFPGCGITPICPSYFENCFLLSDLTQLPPPMLIEIEESLRGSQLKQVLI